MEGLTLESQASHSRSQRKGGTGVLGVHGGNMGMKEELESGVLTHPTSQSLHLAGEGRYMVNLRLGCVTR